MSVTSLRLARGRGLVLCAWLCGCTEGGSAPYADANPPDSRLDASTSNAAPAREGATSAPAPDANAVDAAAASSEASVGAQPDSAVGAQTDANSTPSDAGSEAGAATPRPLASCSPTARLKPGKSSFSLMRDGVQRDVNVYVPDSYDGKKPLPLVVDFHGIHEGAALHELISDWDDSVDANQYVVAMPQGIQNAWNIGPCCTESRSVNDVQFARDLVAKIAGDGCIDTRRIYATGYSNGGGMSFKIACDAADLFAAAAPAAFDLLEEMNCEPSRPISVFIFRGTDDPIVPYAGGASTPPTLYSLSEIHFLGAEKTFQRWAQLNGCAGAPADTGGNCKTYAQCRAGTKVILCTKQGGGHDPSAPGPAWPMLRDTVLP